MQNFEVHARLRFLQVQISSLRAANEAYLKQQPHAPEDVIAHERRKERLHDILEELKELSRRIKAA